MKETDRDLRWKVNGHMRSDVLGETWRMRRILSFSKGAEWESCLSSTEGDACSKA